MVQGRTKEIKMQKKEKEKTKKIKLNFKIEIEGIKYQNNGVTIIEFISPFKKNIKDAQIKW